MLDATALPLPRHRWFGRIKDVVFQALRWWPKPGI
jgi:hypothetical protein